jgi:hypothetical protein
MKASTGRALFVLVIMATGLSMQHADAGELDLRWTFSLGSKHIGAEVDYNEFNPGVGFEARTSEYPELYAMGGVYYNSVEAPSMYGGMGWTPIVMGKHLKLGIEAGLVTGYETAFIQPLVAGTVRVADHAKVLVIPPTPVSPLTFGFQVVY